MKYDAEQYSHRVQLATQMIQSLEGAKFQEEQTKKNQERKFTFDLGKGKKIVVQTSIRGRQVRAVGKDAIRVSVLYNSRFIFHKTVNRVGTLDAINKRLVKAMREAWLAGKNAPCCLKCGAPKFKSKKGNLVCADLCFTNSAWKTKGKFVGVMTVNGKNPRKIQSLR